MLENRSDFGVKCVGSDACETMRWRNEDLPQRPPAADGMSEEDAAGLVSLDMLIGTAR